MQNLGGGHPRALKRGKFTNAELHNFKFPLFCGDLICLDFVTSLHSTKDRIHIKRTKPIIDLIFDRLRFLDSKFSEIEQKKQT